MAVNIFVNSFQAELRQNQFMPCANSKDTDRPVLPYNLMNALLFGVDAAICEIPRLLLASPADALLF